MQNRYEQILEKEGKEAASAYMRSLRAKVKKPGLANVSKKRASEIAKKGWETRENNKAASGAESPKNENFPEIKKPFGSIL